MSTNATILSDPKLKRKYDEYYWKLYDGAEGFVSQVMRFGANQIPTGGASFHWELLLDRLAGAGVPDSSSSVAHIGTETGDSSARKQPSFSMTSLFGRAEMDVRNRATERDGGSFLQEALLKVEDCYESLRETKEILHSNSYDGTVFDAVASTGSEIAAAGSGSVAVSHVQWIPRNTPMGVVRSGSYQANVRLVARNRPNGAGAATITLRNDGSSAWTPTEGDQLVVANEDANAIYFSSCEEACSTGAYPRNEANNTQITEEQFEAIVFDAGNAAIDYEMLRVFLDAIDDNAPEGTWEPYRGDIVGGRQTHPGVVQIAKGLSNQLQKNFEPTRRHTGELDGVDVGWGRYYTVDGIPFVPNKMWPDDRIRYVDTRDFAYGKTEIELLGDGWKFISSKVLEEFIVHERCGIVAQRRNRLGKITSLTGLTTTAVGLTRTA